MAIMEPGEPEEPGGLEDAGEAVELDEAGGAPGAGAEGAGDRFGPGVEKAPGGERRKASHHARRPSSGADTPMMEQHRRIKEKHPGEVLFFRLGDFYEMFGEDALEVSALLNLTLTNRMGQPMCGVPFQNARSYIARLLKAGKKVAICEQITEPGKGLIHRKVVEVITPGTTIDEDFLDKGSPNYLACFAGTGEEEGAPFSFAYIDLSAGDFYASSFPPAGAPERLRLELERLQPRELIIQESLLAAYPALASAVGERTGLVVNHWADWLFEWGKTRSRLAHQFGQGSLKGFGLGENSPEIIAAGALLDYLDDTARTLLPHVRRVTIYRETEFVGIDEATQRNLELIRNLHDGTSRFSLLEVVDDTRTSMGRRLLKVRLLHPLRDEERLRSRLDMVEFFQDDQERLLRLRELLGKTPDLERLSARIAMDKAHGKDLAGVKNALASFSQIDEESRDHEGRELRYESLEALSLDEECRGRLRELRDALDWGLAEDPSIVLTEGNLIKQGYSPELDQLKTLQDSGRQTLEEYLEEEKRATGIMSLKIRYNRLIGYFFEVAKNQLNKVPPRFIRRMGIAQGERFTTDRLSALESQLNGASDRIIELEKKLFLELRERAKDCLSELAAAGRRIAELDVAQSLARAATVHDWVRPRLGMENRLTIIEGRHPVVEAQLHRGDFIPNDVLLDASPPGSASSEGAVPFALITGPNMAGKSTYLRQAALAVVMAQAGSFVPAREAYIGLCDRIYCRVGASDNLARGESTFLVEMNETAYILNTATDRSLVIMDEVGRGTGTNDGLSIAWAVSEELLNRVRCRTLFATHYHELARISHPRMANRSMEVAEQDGELVFLRKLREGAAAQSYGLHVARLAGLPEEVLARAQEIMEELEAQGRALGSDLAAGHAPPVRKSSRDNSPGARLLKTLARLDVNAMTPLEALNFLSKWKAQATVEEPAPPPPVEPSLFD